MTFEAVGWVLVALMYVAVVGVFAAGAASGANWMWRRLTRWTWPRKPDWYRKERR